MPYTNRMPSINDIVTIAEALEKSPVVVVGDRCAAVRNRNSTCRRCEQVCQQGAIDISANEVHLNASSCVACGACCTVCPTGALVPVEPTDAAFAQACAASLEANGDRAVVACARIASKRQADPAAYAGVPCLPRVDESIALAMAAAGAHEVLLVDGNCATCKYRANEPAVDATVASANALLAAQGSATRVRRATGFPEEMLVESAEGLHGTTRRGFFSEAIGAARDTTMTAAKVTIAQDLGYTDAVPAIGERLRVTESGTLPLIEVPRHDVAINALYELGEPVVDEIESRLFASIDIDVQKCNACGMCAVFCPTGAIRRDPFSSVSDPLKLLEFSASSCVNCNLCADVCWKRALTLYTRVSTAQLFDFEPVTFDLTAAQRQRSTLFGSTSR